MTHTMDLETIKEWIDQNLVTRDEAAKITGQSYSGFGQSVQGGHIKPFCTFGTKRTTALYLRAELEEYARNKRIR